MATELRRSLIELKALTVLIDTIVGEVHKLVVKMFLAGRVRLGGKPYKTIMVEIYLDRIHTGYEDIQVEVKL